MAPQQFEPSRQAALEGLTASIAACRICRDGPFGTVLPHEPRPVLRVSAGAVLCIAGQAPGTKVHATGLPFNDASGDRLRDWLGIDRAAFYDVSRVAVVPMGFCFPGQNARGADLPPRRECAATWHDRLFPLMPRLRLLLAIGIYAQAYHLGPLARQGLTRTVAAWREVLAHTAAGGVPILPLPHPSWRNNGWIRRHPWFENELLPELKRRVAEALAEAGGVHASRERPLSARSAR